LEYYALHIWQYLCQQIQNAPVFQVCAYLFFGVIYITVWKFPIFYIGHRIDTRSTTSHLTTTIIVCRALLFRFLRQILQIHTVLSLGALLLVTKGTSIETELLKITNILCFCALLDVSQVIWQYMHHQSAATTTFNVENAPIIPFDDPLRKSLEKVAKQYSLLPENWNESSLRRTTTTTITPTTPPTHPTLLSICGSNNAAAVGSNLILSTEFLQCHETSQVVAVALHELGHIQMKHVAKENQARVVVQIVRAALVVAVALLTSSEWRLSMHPVALYLSVRILIVYPILNPFFRCALNSLAHEQELEADRIACRCGYGNALSSALESTVASHNTNTRTKKDDDVKDRVHPWYSLFYTDHPPLHIRQQAIRKHGQLH
jgi:Zn-dependent protease with chaperone function